MIVSFFSFKGGTGRTMLLANIAKYLYYYRNRRILLIDWDMEAPGIYAYFKTEIEREGIDLKQKMGVLDLFENYKKYHDDLVIAGEDPKPEDVPVFDQNYIHTLLKNEETRATIELIHAGQGEEIEYVQKLHNFDWNGFYKREDNKIYVSFLRKKLLEMDYDYIFIDARTGYSNYNDINVFHLPDVNVVAIAPNEQSFKGCANIINMIKNTKPPYKEPEKPNVIIPVLSRLEDKHLANPNYWRERFAEYFLEVITILKDDEILENNFKKVFKEHFLPKHHVVYDDTLGNGENTVFDEHKTESGSAISKQYENLANLLEYPNHYVKIFVDCAVYLRKDSNNLEANILLLQEVTKNFPDSVSPFLELAKSYRDIREDKYIEYIEKAVKNGENVIEKYKTGNYKRQYGILATIMYDAYLYADKSNIREAMELLTDAFTQEPYNYFIEQAWFEKNSARNITRRFQHNVKEYFSKDDLVIADHPKDIFFYPAKVMNSYFEREKLTVKFFYDQKEYNLNTKMVRNWNVFSQNSYQITCLKKSSPFFLAKLNVQGIDEENHIIIAQAANGDEIRLGFHEFCLTL